MRKTIYTLLWIGMSLLTNLSHAQLAAWTLTTDGSGISSNAHIVVDDLIAGPGLGALQFDPVEGAGTRGWTTEATRSELDYLEFCLSTTNGTPRILSLDFTVWQDADGPSRFDILASTDGFITADAVFSAAMDDPDYTPEVSLSGSADNVDFNICGNTQLCFRIYAYEAESPLGFFGILPNTLEVNGSFPSLCIPPAQQAVISGFSDVTTGSMTLQIVPGSGQGRLIAVRAGSPVAARPCDGVSYASSTLFNSNSAGRLADGSQVLQSLFGGSSLTLTGLAEGTTYHFAVFEATTTNCYNGNPGVASQTTSCSAPTDVSNVTTSVSNGSVSLSWTVPMCNEVMIVASTAPVTGVPTGTGGNYDPAASYGAGMDLNNPPHFSAPEYIVYKDMNNTSATVTGLTNGETYYFRLFSRLGVDWSPGVEVSAMPTDGCPELGGNESIFINEVNHYQNNPNTGIELIGPAGTNLSSYILVLYDLDGFAYDTIQLNGVLPNIGNSGSGVRWVSVPGLEAGNGGIALYNEDTETVVEFVSYRGDVITALNSVAEGMTSGNIGGATRSGTSLQLVGEGQCPSDFTWLELSPPTPGGFNTGQSALPIELLYFRGRTEDDFVRLEWQTVDERDNHYFGVERSADGRKFSEISRVTGGGTTYGVARNYLFYDHQPLPGINYYRLRQVDFDGQFSYTKVVVVSFRSDENVLILYPALGSGQLTLSLAVPLEEKGQLRVFDLTGRLLRQQSLPVDFKDGNFDFSDLPRGAYFLQLESSRERFGRRFIKQ